jgi:hypothetical protein
MGQRSMRERLAAAGGTLIVSSHPQRMVIEALVPAEAIARCVQRMARAVDTPAARPIRLPRVGGSPAGERRPARAWTA